MARLRRLVSGGQTGVDRAALDAAAACDIPRGGWCPRGRRAEDGRVPDEHPLQETPSRAYHQRTEWNVRDSDATLILHAGRLGTGTALTRRIAREMDRPCHCVDLDVTSEEEALAAIDDWLLEHEVEVLNVAGPRESTAPGIYERASEVLQRLLRDSRSTGR